MHGEELRYMREAYETNWMSTVGENISEVEKQASDMLGCGHAVALSSGTAALHLCMKLAGERLYGKPAFAEGALAGRKIFCSDMTFAATVNPAVYEGALPVFIDTEPETWNMDPEALERAFAAHPGVKLIVVAHLYGTPAKIDEIRGVADRYGALIVEDAAESFGASYKGRQTGTFGDYGAISFNGNKIITGSSGGMFLTEDSDDAAKVRKWSTQSRESAPWYQHEELGYNYRMSNVIAGVVRGQLPHLKEHIERKKAIYERYARGFKDIPASMNPMDCAASSPNYWLSCLIIDKEAMCGQELGTLARFSPEAGKSCPAEILEKLGEYNAEGRPVWKPMHMQPVYGAAPFVASDSEDVGADIFARGLCLPSDIKMTQEEQDTVIEIVKRCFA